MTYLVDRLPSWVTASTRCVGGYAAVFDWVDCGDDVIRYGAFFKALAKNRRLSLINAHDRLDRLGAVLLAYQDSHGLYVIAALRRSTDNIRAGVGMSFGYTTPAKRRNAARIIDQAKLKEISLTQNPEQPFARVNFCAPLSEMIQRKLYVKHHLSDHYPAFAMLCGDMLDEAGRAAQTA